MCFGLEKKRKKGKKKERKKRKEKKRRRRRKEGGEKGDLHVHVAVAVGRRHGTEPLVQSSLRRPRRRPKQGRGISRKRFVGKVGKPWLVEGVYLVQVLRDLPALDVLPRSGGMCELALGAPDAAAILPVLTLRLDLSGGAVAVGLGGEAALLGPKGGRGLRVGPAVWGAVVEAATIAMPGHGE